MNTPVILYSFRRCPYAMRARLALKFSGVVVEHREVLLKDKPESMLAYSAKGTVPVLVLSSGRVIDESLDIMLWAMRSNDLEELFPTEDSKSLELALTLIQENDFEFKRWLDCYKYSDRKIENTKGFDKEFCREKGEEFIAKLNHRLAGNAYLAGDKLTFLDLAIAPFVRQFAHVDKEWFFTTSYNNVIHWLKRFLNSDLFIAIMKKHSVWQD